MNQKELTINNKQITNNHNTDYDLVIVGGGIVGATLASALHNSNLKIAIIEAQTLTKAVERKQAYALSLLTGRIFEKIGVWADIFSNIGKFKRIRLSDNYYPHIIKFETQDLNTDYLGYVAEHKYVLSALQKFTQNSPNITWIAPAYVEKVEYLSQNANITIKVNNEVKNLTSKLVIGADGAKSPLRQEAGIKTRGWKYWQSCVAFTIKHEAESNDIAFEKFWQTGPMGILPLPDNRCQIVWTAPHKLAKTLQNMDEKDFIAKLETHTGKHFGKLELVSQRNLFPVQLMQSKNYVKSRLALVGDAAHCCHPVGGQGLNLGIRDAAALAEILQEANANQEDIGQIEVLKRYENWRKKENLAILGVTDFLDRVFSNNFLPIVAIRRFGLWLTNQIHPLKIFALQIMTGLKGKMPKLS